MIAVILAGGSASRMGGGDKGLNRVGGIAIIARLIAVLQKQCDTIVINANGHPSRFAEFGLPVVPDGVFDQPGPLAGILAGMDHAAEHHAQAEFILSVPGDAPFLPNDLVARLQDRRIADRAAIVRARSGGKEHGVTALWAVSLRDDLRRALVTEGVRRVDAFTKRHACASVEWPMSPVDPFLNVNTPEDLQKAEKAAAVIVARR